MATLARWTALFKRLGARGSPESVYAQLAGAYGAPERVYHTFWHVGHCLDEFDKARSLAARPDEVDLALWYHDFICDPREKDAINVERSADAAAQAARSMGLADGLAERVRGLVLVTKHTGSAPDPDSGLVADSDMALLGWSEETFADSYARVRAERRWLEEKLFLESHKRFCKNLLARPAIYLTEFFRQRYEAKARENLERELRRLA
ncbi:MAG: N-methyl-D-aspartate receptor NMDAR2C subunit [Elusimicrobiota bacterium]